MTGPSSTDVICLSGAISLLLGFERGRVESAFDGERTRPFQTIPPIFEGASLILASTLTVICEIVQSWSTDVTIMRVMTGGTVTARWARRRTPVEYVGIHQLIRTPVAMHPLVTYVPV